MNSRQKGARIERKFRDELREQGYNARRGQQFSGANGDPDVVCEDLPWIHFEVKGVERLQLDKAMEQAKRDAKGKVPIVAHKKRHQDWMITLPAEEFWSILRGDHLDDNQFLVSAEELVDGDDQATASAVIRGEAQCG